MKNKSRGFSLLEMLIAMTLASVVLVGIFTAFSSMIRHQIEGAKKSTATGWALASLSKMAKEIEQCTVMPYPSAGSADMFVGCTNWSRSIPGPIVNDNTATLVYYCYDASANAIRRLAVRPIVAPPAALVCPVATAARPACNAGGSAGAGGTNEIIAVDVYKNGGANLFTKDDNIGGVRVRFVVGKQTYTPVAGQPPVVNPQFLKFDTGISLIRSYISSNY